MDSMMPHWGRKDSFRVQGEAEAQSPAASIDEYTYTFSMLQHIGTASASRSRAVHVICIETPSCEEYTWLNSLSQYSADGSTRCAST